MATIKGTNGNDVLNGTPFDDKIDGDDGNDVIFGLGGDDDIKGGKGSDTIDGGDGNDTIKGGSGDEGDSLFGGAGNDEIDGGKGADTIDGGDGNDKIDGGSGADIIFGGAGDERTASGKAGILGGTGNDSIYAQDGNDIVDGGKGDDLIYGGAGNDELLGGSGNDTLSGNAGNDTLDGGKGADFLCGGEGDDLLLGGSGSKDTDTLYGGAGNDTMIGGKGDDEFYVGTGGGHNVVFGDKGTGGSIKDDDVLYVEGTVEVSLNGTTYTLNAGDSLDIVGLGLDKDDDNGVVTLADGTTVAFDEIARIEALDNIEDPDICMDPTANLPPDAVDDTVTVDEDDSVLIAPLGNDSDPNGDPISIDSFTNPSNGTLVDNGDGTFTYTPDADYNGTDSFTYTITDGNGETDTATVNITVDPVNDDPVAVDDTGSGDEDTVITGNVLANDSDVDGDPLEVIANTDPTNGSVVVNADGSYEYTPDANFNGTDSFSYTVSDGNGGTDTATVTLTVDPVNDDPVAVDDTGSGDEDTVITGNVLANDSDVDGDPLEVIANTDPTNGSVVVNADGSYEYTPDANFNGTDSFSYTVSDGNGGTDTATVTLTVDPVNDDPVAVDDTPDTDEDTPVVIPVLANDSDVDGDPLEIDSFTQPPNGTVTDNGDGTVTYEPDPGFNGTDTFTYTVSDGNGGTDTGTVTVTVGAVNDDPTATPDTVPTDEDTPVIFDPTANDSDPDGDPLEVSAIGDPANGTITDNGDGTFTYTPDPDFNGTDTVTYTVSDGNGGTDTGTVTFNVAPVNDDPVAEDDSETTSQGTPVIVPVLANDSDVDGDTLSIDSFTQPPNGTVSDNGDGTLTYTPDPAFSGTDSFTYTVSDGNGGTDTATVDVRVSDVIGPVDGLDSGEGMGPGYTDLQGDQIDGSDGDDDTIFGNGGDDTIDSGEGDDTVDGGGGDDTFVVTETGGGIDNDVIIGGETDETDGDTVDTSDIDDDLEVVFSAPEEGTITDGADTTSFEEIENIVLGGGDDTVTGSDGDENVDGGEGNNEMDGGDGDDTLKAGGGDDTIDGGDGDDSLVGGGGDNELDGGDGDDTIEAGSGNDTITGGDGSDSVDGGNGDNLIDTSGGSPLVDDKNGDGFGFASYGPFPAAPADPDENDDRDFVVTGSGDDTITTGDDADTIFGGSGDNVIDGGIDDDVITTTFGDDLIIGGEGSDTISAGAGNDTIYGGLDPAFPDALNIPDAPDGGAFGPDPDPENGRDFIEGGAGNDLIYGQDDDDTIFGGGGADTIFGGIDDDFIDGGAIKDDLYGGQGNDTILGGSGSDNIEGGEGADSMEGGDDNDRFIIGAREDAFGDVVIGGNGPDENTDRDILDLRGLGKLAVIGEVADGTDAGATKGTVNFLAADGVTVEGTLTFSQIERLIICFTPGVAIATPKGEVAVEDLKAGDRVITRDDGVQEIRWIGTKKVSAMGMQADPSLRPVLIRKGALGNGLPERDMMVSPNHRMLMANEHTHVLFDEREVLVAAKHLVGQPGIERADVPHTEYIHVMFDRHEVILGDGAWTESFHPGDYSLKGIDKEQRDEIFKLFPELMNASGLKNYGAARHSLKGYEAKMLREGLVL